MTVIGTSCVLQQKKPKTAMTSKLQMQIFEILEKVQTSSGCHQKCQLLLLNLYKSADKEDFYNNFERVLTIVLNQNPRDKNIHAERACDFCASFCAAVELNANLQASVAETALFEKVLDFLLEVHNLEEEAVRYRVCQLTNKILNNLSGAELSEDLCDKIEDAMLQRLQDNKSEVRYQAIAAVYRLQDPTNEQCRIIPDLIRHMNGDCSRKVRQLCVEKIAIRREVLAALLTRTRDISVDVRRAAFTRLSKLVKHMKISERHKVILTGFADSCKEINNFVATQLVTSWLSDYDYNYLKLLEAMRLDSTENEAQEMTKVIEYILRSLFSSKPCEEILDVVKVDANCVMAFEDLNCVSAIYWRCLVETCRKADDYESLLNSILPDLVHFAVYIQKYCKVAKSNPLEFQLVLNQLFIITQGYDLSDTVSRQVLVELVANTLRDVEDLNPNIVTTIIRNLEEAIPSIDHWTKFVCEIISDIMCPTTGEEKRSQDDEFQIAQIKLQLNCAQENQNRAVQEEDYESAAKYKEQINLLRESLSALRQSLATPQPIVKKTDAPTVVRCLNIARGMLISKRVSALNHILRTLNESTVLEFLTHEDAEVRVKALECYALCCIVDRRSAQKGIHVFAACLLANTIEENCDVESLLVAIRAVNDLLVLFGPAIMREEENDELPLISFTQIVQTLADLMDNENVEIQERAGLSLCNLILHGRVHSASLISRMVLKWCNPASDEDTQCLRQHIGMMLEELPTLNGSADQLEKAVLPTIKTLLKAPPTSPLSEVNVLDVAKFMLALCSACEEASNLHCHLAVTICSELKDDPQNPSGAVLAKTLLMLDLSAGDYQLIHGLINLCDEFRDDVANRLVLSNVLKFIAYLESLNKRDVSVVEEENEE